MKITILNNEYEVLETKEKITIADSFVVRQNKIGGGNGEAKLYVGQDNQEIRVFLETKVLLFVVFYSKKIYSNI